MESRFIKFHELDVVKERKEHTTLWYICRKSYSYTRAFDFDSAQADRFSYNNLYHL